MTQSHNNVIQNSAYANINLSLNKIKKIFDLIEPYDENSNIGFRSIKNIGVWLTIYSLVDEEDQSNIVDELIKLTNNKLIDKKLLKNELDTLSQKDNLNDIIDSYQIANGDFAMSITANEKNLAELRKKLPHDFCKYTTFTNDDQVENNVIFHIQMENTIKFYWAGAKDCQEKKTEYTTTTKTFQKNETEFLSANDKQHDISYELITHEKELFHVARLGILHMKKHAKEEKQTNEEKISTVSETDDLDLIDMGKKIMEENMLALQNVFGHKSNGPEYDKHNLYIIQPNKNNSVNLQTDYLDILNSSKELSNEARYCLLKNSNIDKNILMINEKTETEVISCSQQDKGKTFTHYVFNYSVHFPQLSSKLSTTEERTGIYSVFKNKQVLGCNIEKVSYLGLRELSYDKTGGEIYNYESCILSGMVGSSLKPYTCVLNTIYVNVEFTVSNTYMMICDMNNGADYYPFLINNPNKGLVNVFNESKKYDQKSSQLKSYQNNMGLFTSEEKGNVEISNNTPEKSCCILM